MLHWHTNQSPNSVFSQHSKKILISRLCDFPQSGAVAAKKNTSVEMSMVAGLPHFYHESLMVEIGSFEEQ
jgi:hypothetical protein